MKLLQTILILLIALEHIYFLILEMFLWTSAKGIKTFGLKSLQFPEETKILAGNQGLYNGFLAAGLLYALINKDSSTIIFFLVCIIIAGIYGAISTKKVKLFYVQSIPAIVTLILSFLV